MKRAAIIVAVIVGMFATVATSKPMEMQRANERLQQAEQLAKKREIDAAADIYRAVLREGHDGVGIRYNLGTLALDQGKVGEAVLQLRIAHKMAPGDDDVQHNLAVALDARTDRLAGEATFDPVHALGERTGPLLARNVFLLPLMVLGILLAALGFVADDRRLVRRALSFGAIACAALSLLGGFVYAARVSIENEKEAVIVVDQTPALKEPDDAAALSFTAHAGLYGDVVDDNAGFSRVRFENGLEAWIKSDALALE